MCCVPINSNFKILEMYFKWLLTTGVYFIREQVTSQVQQPEQLTVCKKHLFIPYTWEVDVKCAQHELNHRPSFHSNLTWQSLQPVGLHVALWKKYCGTIRISTLLP